MTYAEQLKHPEWQKKRLEVMEYAGFTCQQCASKDEQLNVHHTYYRKGAKAWEYQCCELLCLCHSCHTKHHDLDDVLKKAIGRLSLEEKMQVLGYADERTAGGFMTNDDKWYQKGFLDAVRGNDSWLAYLHHSSRRTEK